MEHINYQGGHGQIWLEYTLIIVLNCRKIRTHNQLLCVNEGQTIRLKYMQLRISKDSKFEYGVMFKHYWKWEYSPLFSIAKRLPLNFKLLIQYSGFCRWGPNLCKLCEFLWGHKFNSAVTLALLLFSSLLVSQLCAGDFFILCLCSNTSKEGHFCFAARPKGPKDRNGCVNDVHKDIATLLQCS